MYSNLKKNRDFKLTEEEYFAITKEKQRYESARSAVIEVLKIIQKNRGWVSDEAIYVIADILHLPASDIEGIATFYSGIFRKPVGRHIIRYCDGVVCYITGYKTIKNIIERKLNIIAGQTTSDCRFTLLPACCLGNCDNAPVIMIDEDIYNNVNTKEILILLEQYK